MQFKVIQCKETGSPLWDASVALADVLQEVFKVEGRWDTVIEIGAGCALPSIVASQLSMAKRVIATELDQEMDLVRTNCIENQANVECIEYYWGTDVDKVFGPLGKTLILAADCVYEIQCLELLVKALSDLVQPTCKILMAMEHRWKDVEDTFWELLKSKGLQAKLYQGTCSRKHESIDIYWITRDSIVTSNQISDVAVVQMTSTNDILSNLEICRELCRQASEEGVSFLAFPEATDFIASSPQESLKLLHSPEYSTFCLEIKRLAREYQLWISIGIHRPAREKMYNSLWLINPSGTIVAEYDKIHLFDIALTNGPNLSESDWVVAGDRLLPPISTPIGNIGLAICYDLRFPELSLQLRKLGADIILYPSAFTVKTGQDHWIPLLQARAIETQCFVIAAAQVGQHNSRRNSWGEACIIDPWGTILCKEKGCLGSQPSAPSISTARLNFSQLHQIRNDMPIMTHRKALFK